MRLSERAGQRPRSPGGTSSRCAGLDQIEDAADARTRRSASPAAIASMAPLGNASDREGSTKTSARCEQRGDVFAMPEELDVRCDAARRARALELRAPRPVAGDD